MEEVFGGFVAGVEATLERLCALPQVCAVGETGLDFFYNHSPHDVQAECFRRQCQLAKTLGKPVVIHVRDAHEQCAEILKSEGMSAGQIHCFTGNTGQGNPLHLAMEMLMRETGFRIQAVPFRGDAPLNTALISGDIQVAIVPVATALANIEAKMIKALAVSTAKRSIAVPDLPTIAEQGLPGFAAESWQGLFVPSATPRAIIERIQTAVKQAMGDPTVQARMKMFGSDIVASTPDVFAAKFKADVAKYAAIIKEAKIPLQ